MNNDHLEPSLTPSSEQVQRTLKHSVESALKTYLAQLDGAAVTNIYDLFLTEMEAPLLKTTMAHVNHNQTKAAELLGLNRGTLRKKLKQYNI